MNSLLMKVLVTIIKALVGSLNYQRIVGLVVNAESSPLSGPEKRAAVIADARNVGLAVATALLNLAIETAVNSLRSK